MTKYQVNKSDDGIEIEIEGVDGDKQARLLESFQECQEGN